VKNVEEMLSEQLELLAEASKKERTQKGLCDLSMAMASIAGEIRLARGPDRLAYRPDNYELRPHAEQAEVNATIATGYG